MNRLLALSFVMATTMPFLLGCGSKPQPPAPEEKPATPDQLIELWDQLTVQPKEKLDFQLAHAVATDMNNRGENGIQPILDRLDVPEPSPQVIVLTSATLRFLVNESHEDALIELTKAEHSSRTRRVAIDLLGGIETDKAIQRITELEKDSDLLISVGAYLARLHRGDADYVARLKTYWENPEVHDMSRMEMLRRIPDVQANIVIDQLCEAVNKTDWDVDVRQRCISILGFTSEPKALEALQKAAEIMPEQEVREFAKMAAAAMKSRMDKGQVVEHFEVGPGGISSVNMPLTAEPATSSAEAPAEQ